MVFAETPRLILRRLEKADLPALTRLIGEWEVVRWLVSVPYPYRAEHSEEFYATMEKAYQNGQPEYFLMQRKADNTVIGGIGLHPSREEDPPLPDELVIGYWLGRDYWGQGCMTEGVRAVIDLGFGRPEISVLTATTDPANQASQNVLRKAGLDYLGLSPQRDKRALRGSETVTRWQLTRDVYEKKKAVA